MAARLGLGYAAAGVIVAGSIIAATAATVGLHTQQAREAAPPSTPESALVTSAPTMPAPASPGTAPAAALLAEAGTSIAATVPLVAQPSPTQPLAAAAPAVAPQQLTATTAISRRTRDDDDDEHEEHEERESVRRAALTSFRREHR